MADFAPVSFGSIGLGGYAGSICDLLLSESVAGGPVRLEAVCEPDQGPHAARIEMLKSKGIQVFHNYEELLATDVEAVWLPLPIPLHRPFTEKALAAGKAVMCEKPAAGSVEDLDAMIAARDRVRLPVAIGFQHMYMPEPLLLKRQLLCGAIGQVRSATLYAYAPRDRAYYQRNSWAGKLKQGGAWVLDSPASNALAHYIMLALFLLGPDEQRAAECESIEAELYRANAIENYDTCGIRGTTADGREILVLLTHACAEGIAPQIEIKGDRGAVRCVATDRPQIEGVSIPAPKNPPADTRAYMVQHFAALVRGRSPDGVTATLELARAHLAFANGASQACPVRNVPAGAVGDTTIDGLDVRFIRGIEAAFRSCAQTGRMLHESGLLPWTSPAGRLDLRSYREFRLAGE